MPPFKDEHILIIAPGSQTTLAQLGLPESFTPAQHRFRSRVFLSEDGKTYDPHKLVKKAKEEVADGEDVDMDGTGGEDVYIEDPNDEEGAIWPLKGLTNRIPSLEML
jgi:actin-related protein 9